MQLRILKVCSVVLQELRKSLLLLGLLFARGLKILFGIFVIVLDRQLAKDRRAGGEQGGLAPNPGCWRKRVATDLARMHALM